MAFLLWIREGDSQLRFPLGEQASIGRSSECDIQMVAPSLSRRHAVIVTHDGGYFLEDADSTSGTYLNGSKVAERTRLSPGDCIRVGSEELLFDPPIDVLHARNPRQSIYLLLDSEPTAATPLEAGGPAGGVERLARRLLDAMSNQAVVDALVEELAKTFEADHAALVASGEAGWRALAVHSESGQAAVSLRLLDRVASEGQAMLLEDAVGDVRFRGAKSVIDHQLRSVMAVPIFDGDRVVAIAQVDRQQTGAYGQRSLQRLAALAEVAGAALRRAALLASPGGSAVPAADALIGESKALKGAIALAAKAAESDARVIIHGESGTGKELLARYIHEHSPRRGHPWVAINCAAFSPGLIDSGLFGHEMGAFTGAQDRRAGCFEQADGGTLFLDEVAELSLDTQAKLLRALQEGRFYRVGGQTPVAVEVRVIAASHRDLGEEVKAGRFREDLLYRLRVIEIAMPSLRERPSDIPLLTRHFLAELAGVDGPVLSPAVVDCWQRYRWPGNVRELRNAIERLVVLCSGTLVEPEHLPPEMKTEAHPGRSVGSLADAVDALEEQMISQAMHRCAGNKSQAARALGISRPTLDKKLKKLGIKA